jgi:hypothetical protein
MKVIHYHARRSGLYKIRSCDDRLITDSDHNDRQDIVADCNYVLSSHLILILSILSLIQCAPSTL